MCTMQNEALCTIELSLSIDAMCTMQNDALCTIELSLSIDAMCTMQNDALCTIELSLSIDAMCTMQNDALCMIELSLSIDAMCTMQNDALCTIELSAIYSHAGINLRQGGFRLYYFISLYQCVFGEITRSLLSAGKFICSCFAGLSTDSGATTGFLMN